MNIKRNGKLFSAYFDLPSRGIDIRASFKGSSVFCTFPDFSRSLLNLSSGYNTSATMASTTSYLIVSLFLLIIAMHDVRFVEHVFVKRKIIHVPTFLEPMLVKVALRVNSKNRITSWSKGELNCSDISDLISTLRSWDANAWSLIFIGTFLESAMSKKYTMESFYRDIHSLFPEESDDLETYYDNLLAAVSNFVQSYRYPSDYSSFDGYLEYSESNNLGIYRFRNDKFDNCYIAQQISLDNVKDETVAFLACFLRLFAPSFTSKDGVSLPSTLLSGDAVVDVSNLSLLDAWTKYISYNRDGTGNSSTKPVSSMGIYGDQNGGGHNAEAPSDEGLTGYLYYVTPHKEVYRYKSSVLDPTTAYYKLYTPKPLDDDDLLVYYG